MKKVVRSYLRFLLAAIVLTAALTPSTVNAQQALLNQRKGDMAEGIRYNESIYLISNYSATDTGANENLSIEELLEKPIEGLYFYLKQDNNKNILLRNPDGTFSSFKKALSVIKDAITNDPYRIITLFLDYNVDIDLESALTECGLIDNISTSQPDGAWPQLKEMVDSNKNLVLFEVQKHVNTPQWLQFADDFMDITDETWSNYSDKPVSFDERMKHNLSLFSGYRFFHKAGNRDITEIARHTPYFIESFKNYWISSGKIPNFVIIDKYYSWMYPLLMNLRNYNLVFGFVTCNNENVSYVNWEGMANATTGVFCFPKLSGTDLTISPSVPGYNTGNKSITIKDDGRKNFIMPIIASPLSIEKDIELHLDFNDRIRDLSDKKRPISYSNIDDTYEPSRGNVAVFGDSSQIDLPTAMELNINEHNFTVGAWIKIPEYLSDKSDYCIIGSENGMYQHGLHLEIRDGKPFMGFFNNDLQGNTLIEPNTWHYIIWRYNNSNGEQSIFVDGVLDAISTGRPSYQGKDKLFVGIMSHNPDTHFLGMIDNLTIWSRVLSPKEILGLSNQVISINCGKKPSMWLHLLGWVTLAAAILTVAAITFWLFQKASKMKGKQRQSSSNGNSLTKQVSKQNQDNILRKKSSNKCSANEIRLFGEFKVTDSKGIDITSMFTPKLKQLFLLILIYSSGEQTGIAGNDLSEQLWGKDGKDTKSLRSVSILKLRKILENLDKVEIVFNGNKYILQFSNDVYCDYIDCLGMFDKHINNKDEFEHFFKIISRGEIFKNESFPWLDDFKSDVCNKTVDTLTSFIKTYSAKDEPEKVIDIAEQIEINDPCNEEALSQKVKSLVSKRQFKQARYAYDKFCNLYKEMFAEDYNISFDNLTQTESKEK